MTQTTLVVQTSGPGLYEVTDRAQAFVYEMKVSVGLATAFVRHTSCSLLVQENADPDVRRDLDAYLRRLVPPADHPTMGFLKHRAEGNDDMPAHIKSALMAVSISIPITAGRLALGTWQGLYLFEHRDRPHRREIVLHVTAPTMDPLFAGR